MFKNQLQELAQRSCFNLPCYACIREGPDHAPRFKASVNFNGEIFECLSYCNTLRQAEHAAAEVALNVLSSRGPSRSLTARILDETGIYKNLLQETAHRAGLNLPVYTTIRSGPGHVPTFTCTVELAGMSFNGESAKTKKQAEKNAAISAWSALKRMPNLNSLTSKEVALEEQDQAVVARVLSNFRSKDEYKLQEARKRDYYRRKMVKSYKDHSSSSSNLSNSPNYKLLDLLLDSATENLNKKQSSSFVSLLPPPPPRTTSRILPPANPIPYIHRETQIPVEEHQKDEEEWLGEAAKKSLSSIYRQFPHQESKPTTINDRFYSYPSHRIAPAVQIRSVIPVCAAPPVQLRPPPPPPSLSVITATNSKSIKTEAASSLTVNERATARPTESSTLSNETQLSSSEFDKKLQLMGCHLTSSSN
ncbi:double-stranded RNA-binding protein 3 isoform X2 [Mercurialis annua]|nr:double-stranded RNA-binding protein 3 isoform X2 [Mercurialis annua]